MKSGGYTKKKRAENVVKTILVEEQNNTKLGKLSSRNFVTLKKVTIAFLQERCYLKERCYIISLQEITVYVKDASIIFLLELYHMKEH